MSYPHLALVSDCNVTGGHVGQNTRNKKWADFPVSLETKKTLYKIIRIKGFHSNVLYCQHWDLNPHSPVQNNKARVQCAWLLDYSTPLVLVLTRRHWSSLLRSKFQSRSWSQRRSLSLSLHLGLCAFDDVWAEFHKASKHKILLTTGNAVSRNS